MVISKASLDSSFVKLQLPPSPLLIEETQRTVVDKESAGEGEEADAFRTPIMSEVGEEEDEEDEPILFLSPERPSRKSPEKSPPNVKTEDKESSRCVIRKCIEERKMLISNLCHLVKGNLAKIQITPFVMIFLSWSSSLAVIGTLTLEVHLSGRSW